MKHYYYTKLAATVIAAVAVFAGCPIDVAAVSNPESAQRKAEAIQGRAEAAQRKAEAIQDRAEAAQRKAEAIQGRAEAAQRKAEAAQGRAEIMIDAKAPAGMIDPLLYGQLFEHIYFSPNNGVWNEMIFERSFEPEQYPGIHPRDGYFDGWFMDDNEVLHSPTRYEQPLEIVSLDTDDYVMEMDVNWRSYRLARRSWSGGLMDIRFAFRNGADGEPYYVRLHNPYYEVRTFTPAQTESQIRAAEEAKAREALQRQENQPYFAIARMVEKETTFFGRTRMMKTLDPVVSKVAGESQINENQDWHKLKIVSRGKSAKVYWDGRQVLSYSKLEETGHNDIVFWVNYTEATYRNIKVSSPDGKKVYFEGTPRDVQIPEVAQQWTSFGDARFSLIKGDAVNMDYSQCIDAGKTATNEGKAGGTDESANAGNAGSQEAAANAGKAGGADETANAGNARSQEAATNAGKAEGAEEAADAGSKGKAGVQQGPQNVVAGERYIGSIYAKGDGKLSVAFKNGEEFIGEQVLGVPGSEWKKFEFEIPADDYSGDADFAIAVEGGKVQIDAVSLMSATGLSLGGFRPDILETVKDLHPTCMRWPGGGYAAQYDWKWGIGPQEKRQRWAHWMWMDYDQNCFGTDEFIKFCREVDSEPVIVVSVAFERPESEYQQILENACNWLRYCNEPATGEWGALRAANGHPEPYNVKYWEIDNEMWEMGIERYERCVRDFSTAMREIDPDIKIIACGGFQEDKDFLMRSGNYFDYLSLHHYENRDGYASGADRLGKQYDNYAEMIAECPNPNIKLFISEWNLQSIDWRTGLFAGNFLNMCESKDVVAMGAAALFIRRTDSPDWNNAFINFDYKDVFVAPNYQITNLWYDHFSRYRLDYEGDTAGLSVSTTMSENGKDVIVKVVNSSEESRTLVVKGNWKALTGGEYKYYAPGSLDAANIMEEKNAVELKTVEAGIEDSAAEIEVEALSAGVLVLHRLFE